MLYEVFPIVATNSLILWNTKMFVFFRGGINIHNLSCIDLYVVCAHYLEFYIGFLLQLSDLRNDIIHTAILNRLLWCIEKNDCSRWAEQEVFFHVVQIDCYLLCGAVDWLFGFSRCSASGVAIQLFHSEGKKKKVNLASPMVLLLSEIKIASLKQTCQHSVVCSLYIHMMPCQGKPWQS